MSDIPRVNPYLFDVPEEIAEAVCEMARGAVRDNPGRSVNAVACGLVNALGRTDVQTANNFLAAALITAVTNADEAS